MNQNVINVDELDDASLTSQIEVLQKSVNEDAEKKENQTTGYNFELVQEGLNLAAKEKEQFINQRKLDLTEGAGFDIRKWGTPENTLEDGTQDTSWLASLSPADIIDINQTFKPKPGTQMKILGVGNDELGFMAQSFSRSAGSNIEDRKEFMTNYLKYYNEDAEVLFLNELIDTSPEGSEDSNRIQQIMKTTGISLDVAPETLVYRVSGQDDWQVVNAPGASQGDLGYYALDIAKIIPEVLGFAAGGPKGAALAAAASEAMIQTSGELVNVIMDPNMDVMSAEGLVEIAMDGLGGSWKDAGIDFVATGVMTKAAEMVFGFATKRALKLARSYLPVDVVKMYERALRNGDKKTLVAINKQLAEKMPGSKKVNVTIGQALDDPIIKGTETFAQGTNAWVASNFNELFKQRSKDITDTILNYQRKALGLDDAPTSGVGTVEGKFGQTIVESAEETFQKEIKAINQKYISDDILGEPEVIKLFHVLGTTLDNNGKFLIDTETLAKQVPKLDTDGNVIQGQTTSVLENLITVGRANYNKELKNFDDQIAKVFIDAKAAKPDINLDELIKPTNLVKTMFKLEKEFDNLLLTVKDADVKKFLVGFRENLKDGRKTKNFSYEQVQKTLQYLNSLSIDDLSQVAPGIGQGAIRELAAALRVDIKKQLTKNLGVEETNKIFKINDQIIKFKNDYNRGAVAKLFKTTDGGKITKIVDGNVTDMVLNNPIFAKEIAGILDSPSMIPEKEAFKKSILNTYFKSVYTEGGEMVTDEKVIAQKAAAWLKANGENVNLFLDEKMVKMMRFPKQFRKMVSQNAASRDLALKALHKEYDDITSLDPANMLKYFMQNPSKIKGVINNLNKNSPFKLGDDVLKQVKEMSFERMQANIVQFDDAIGSNMINGKAIERFFSMANDQGMTNRSFYSKVFGEKFVNNMTDIGSILKLLQSGGDEEFIKVMSRDGELWKGTRNLLLGQLDRKRTFIRGLKQLAKEINNRDMFKALTDFDEFMKTYQSLPFNAIYKTLAPGKYKNVIAATGADQAIQQSNIPEIALPAMYIALQEAGLFMKDVIGNKLTSPGS